MEDGRQRGLVDLAQTDRWDGVYVATQVGLGIGITTLVWIQGGIDMQVAKFNTSSGAGGQSSLTFWHCDLGGRQRDRWTEDLATTE